jgi:hypothetical protein
MFVDENNFLMLIWFLDTKLFIENNKDYCLLLICLLWLVYVYSTKFVQKQVV